jgi:hypothetical protein
VFSIVKEFRVDRDSNGIVIKKPFT